MHVPKDVVAPRYLEWVKRYGVAVQEYPCYHQHSSRPRRVDLLLLSFIVAGQARHQIKNAEFAAGPGSVGITRYGESHMLVTAAKGVRIYNIYLDPRRHSLPLAPGELRRMQSLLFPEREGFHHQLNRSMHFQLEHPDDFLAIVRQIEREIADEQAGVEEVVRALLKVVVVSCCRAALASGLHPAESKDGGTPPWILALCRHMDRHFDQARAVLENFVLLRPSPPPSPHGRGCWFSPSPRGRGLG
jgi:hypothetical protein